MLTTHAREESTYVITCSFTDEDGQAVSPTTAVWTLTDTSGNVINNRQDVAISSPASSEDIVLKGDDLAIQQSESGDVVRILTVEATYDSSLGSGLPLKESVRFILDNLVAVS